MALLLEEIKEGQPLTAEDLGIEYVTIYPPPGCFLHHSGNYLVLLEPYQISKFNITVGQWEKYCKAKGKSMPSAPNFNQNWEKKDHPIVSVSWDECTEMVNYIGRKLPNEQQWEYAARGGLIGKKYPWGDEWDPSMCHFAEHRHKWGGGTAPVGQYPPNGYGIYDMAGNTWEWCADAYSDANKPKDEWPDYVPEIHDNYNVRKWKEAGNEGEYPNMRYRYIDNKDVTNKYYFEDITIKI